MTHFFHRSNIGKYRLPKWVSPQSDPVRRTMIASAIIVPAVTSALASVASSLILPQRTSDAGASAQTSANASCRPLDRRQGQKLTSLQQQILESSQGCFPKTRPDSASVNAQKAKGVGIVMGGAVVKDVGHTIANSHGTLGKVLGTAMALGGQVAQLYGAEKIQNADRR
jgi:hypothetical protein